MKGKKMKERGKAWAPPFDVVFFLLATSGYLGPI
jgi:hypothetical protein